MKCAIVSDIHANLQAWKAVLLEIRSLGVDRILCLGDVVGYGPHPGEVLQSVHANVHHIVLGNHDATICGKMDASLFNPAAREIIQWTAGRLNDQAIRFLRSLPLSICADHFRCAHGDFAEPAAFNYVIEPEDALPSWRAVDEELLFIGHTHKPGIFLLGPSGIPRGVEPQDFIVEPGKRYLVNVGSVGQPRDGGARACYCLYDTADRSVRWRRVPFDIDAYRQALEAEGLSAKPSYFLRHDPRLAAPPIRELLNFSPPSSPDMLVQDAVRVQEVALLRRDVRRWRRLFAAVLAATLAAAVTAGVLWWRHAGRVLELGPAAAVVLDAVRAPEDHNLLPSPALPLDPASATGVWALRLGNRYRQGAKVESDPGAEGLFVLRSHAPRDEIRLASPVIRVEPGMRLTLQGLFRKSEDFAGTVAVVVSLTKQTDSGRELVDQFLVKEPNVPRQGGWLEARKTFDVPAGGCSLRLQVRARFSGEVRVKDLSLCRR